MFNYEYCTVLELFNFLQEYTELQMYNNNKYIFRTTYTYP